MFMNAMKSFSHYYLSGQGQEGMPLGEVHQQPQAVCQSVQDLV